MTDGKAGFPSFLYRDGPRPNLEVEPCEQVAAAAGVAWAALKLFGLALYALVRALACQGALCALRRLHGMTASRAYFVTHLTGHAYGLCGGLLIFL